MLKSVLYLFSNLRYQKERLYDKKIVTKNTACIFYSDKDFFDLNIYLALLF